MYELPFDIVALGLTPDIQRVFFNNNENTCTLSVGFKTKLKPNKNFYPRNGFMKFLEESPSKEFNALYYLSLYSDKHNSVILNSQALSEAMAFVEMHDTVEASRLIDNMVKLSVIVLFSGANNKWKRIFPNPNFAGFRNTLNEMDMLAYFAIINSRNEIETPIRKTIEYDGEIVYLLTGWDNYTKIGRTSDLKSRVKAHSTSNPGAKLLFAIQGDGKTEGKLHNHFKDKRIKLEWFDLTENDLQWIRENNEVVS